jgi:type I restriction enzyme S subunit
VTELPHGWASTTLGEIAETQLGKMLSARARTGNSGRAYLRNKNVQWGRLDLDDVFRMDFSDAEFEKFRLREGDLLVCEGGEVGRAAIWRGQLPECAYQKALHRVRPRGGVQPEFLLYLFTHYSHARRFDEYVTGSTIKHLPQEDVRLLPVPLPPLAEQRRIVAAIEEQLSRLDAASLLLASARKRARVLREGALAAAFDSHGPRRELRDVLREPLRNGYSAKASPDGTTRVITLSAVTRGEFSERNTKLAHVDAERASRLWLEPGDILIERSNTPELVGTAALYDGPRHWAIYPDLLIRLRMNDLVTPDYVALALQTPAVRRYFQRSAQGIAGSMPKISQDTIERLKIPVPPRAEQAALVERVDAALSRVAAVTAAAEEAARRADGLRASILAGAFRGELVPQDPDDEPATVLLERIAAERAASAPARPLRKRVQAAR